ncbi:MAG: response regulator [Syntrophaceae bacterium]|nr:response regulator [Syntrophaceae bacterium]
MAGFKQRKDGKKPVSGQDLEKQIQEMEIHFRHVENEYLLSQEESRKATLRYIEIMEELRRKNESLEALKNDLEERVKIRTASLEASNKALTEEIEKNKVIQKELREKDKKLLYAQKMEAVGTLAGGIAHDFNNLLMCIQGNISLVLMGLDSSHNHFDKIKNIEDQVKSGVSLTRQLLNFAIPREQEFVPVDMNEIISKTAAMFGRTRKELVIEEILEPELGFVKADKGQIEQVLLNLYVNASQAMPGGGHLTLRTEGISLSSEEARTYFVQEGDFVRISITDTGVGMDEKTRERIFDPFFTTKEMGRGYGLGLASVYGIVRGHQGFVEVHSQKGKGSTFILNLPKAYEHAESREIQTKEDILRGQETVLFVDDEMTIIEVMQDILEALGYRVLTANSGEEAVRIYNSTKDEVDLVILDVIMPGMGGMETFEAIRALNPKVKVILSSGYSMNQIAKEIMDKGCRAFIQKPFNIETISQKVREVLQSA